MDLPPATINDAKSLGAESAHNLISELHLCGEGGQELSTAGHGRHEILNELGRIFGI